MTTTLIIFIALAVTSLILAIHTDEEVVFFIHVTLTGVIPVLIINPQGILPIIGTYITSCIVILIVEALTGCGICFLKDKS